MTRARIVGLATLIVMSPLPAPAADIAAMGIGQVGRADVTLSGDVVAGDAERLEGVVVDLLDGGVEVRRLDLDSQGGDAGEGMRLARTVRALRLATHVADAHVCASACFLAYAAGIRKSAGAGAILAVHSSSLQGASTEYTRRVDAAEAGLLRGYDTPEAITTELFDTPPGEIYRLTRRDERAMKVEVEGTEAGGPLPRSWRDALVPPDALKGRTSRVPRRRDRP